jgi:hypothetical protein
MVKQGEHTLAVRITGPSGEQVDCSEHSIFVAAP